MEYDKPHLTLPEQLERLRDRGAVVPDPARALRLLETVGYYRLSAYAYPFREVLPGGVPRDTSVQYRGSQFIAGTNFDWIEALWDFDRDLRLLILDGLELVEIALRSKVGYHLGARDKFAYLSTENLDLEACNRANAKDPSRTLYETWLERYLEHQADASAEDFIKHYVEKYDSKLPIWVATEILEFGPLVRLLGFMRADDQSRISGDIARVSGAVFYGWAKVANYVRNVSAHHARLWNRTLTYKLAKVPDNVPALLHLNDRPSHRARIYGFCAVLAYLTQQIRPESAWAARFRDLMAQFPSYLPLNVSHTMGLPDGWEDLPVWADAARTP